MHSIDDADSMHGVVRNDAPQMRVPSCCRHSRRCHHQGQLRGAAGAAASTHIMLMHSHNVWLRTAQQALRRSVTLQLTRHTEPKLISCWQANHVNAQWSALPTQNYISDSPLPRTAARGMQQQAAIKVVCVHGHRLRAPHALQRAAALAHPCSSLHGCAHTCVHSHASQCPIRPFASGSHKCNYALRMLYRVLYPPSCCWGAGRAPSSSMAAGQQTGQCAFE